jgi:hypothetical protein
MLAGGENFLPLQSSDTELSSRVEERMLSPKNGSRQCAMLEEILAL